MVNLRNQMIFFLALRFLVSWYSEVSWELVFRSLVEAFPGRCLLSPPRWWNSASTSCCTRRGNISLVWESCFQLWLLNCICCISVLPLCRLPSLSLLACLYQGEAMQWAATSYSHCFRGHFCSNIQRNYQKSWWLLLRLKESRLFQLIQGP